jgi:hypothetical protein
MTLNYYRRKPIVPAMGNLSQPNNWCRYFEGAPLRAHSAVLLLAVYAKGAGNRGSSSQKVAPLPAIESKPPEPPIRSTSSRVITKPRPVPRCSQVRRATPTHR